MDDREATLRRLSRDLQAHDAVADAFLAKSFTDRLLIVDVADGAAPAADRSDGEVPRTVRERLVAHDCLPAAAVFEDDAAADGLSFQGTVGEATRHHFVDVRSRGEHRSYVVE
jgi:hypothetical protein